MAENLTDRSIAALKPKAKRQHIFDKPRNVKRLLRIIYGLCAAALLFDFIVPRHALRTWEGVPGFYAIYGFVGCALLVLVAKELRKFLMRREDYYDR